MDPKGERTLGVVTKPDLVDKGAEDPVMHVINNQSSVSLGMNGFLDTRNTGSKCLVLVLVQRLIKFTTVLFQITLAGSSPWVVVKGRSQEDINNNMPIDQAMSQEVHVEGNVLSMKLYS